MCCLDFGHSYLHFTVEMDINFYQRDVRGFMPNAIYASAFMAVIYFLDAVRIRISRINRIRHD
ncbi:hypothetical protein MTBBW1_1200032 [Desulfamplus magnetovallimortis]|uniref:Uncharacterized protein n=1 Tax=Desulfamplus magnetovallimortis TaxID=1246637 RepID=A0A1W1H676_9BACT|nr:hypothetical protein MTBBW1_1200032 [Desulfamplus magnetovallimortis]